jgi:hypothetical protein
LTPLPVIIKSPTRSYNQHYYTFENNISLD